MSYFPSSGNCSVCTQAFRFDKTDGTWTSCDHSADDGKEPCFSVLSPAIQSKFLCEKCSFLLRVCTASGIITDNSAIVFWPYQHGWPSSLRWSNLMVGTRYSHAQPQESQSFYDQLIEIFASPDDRLPFIDFPVREIANPAAARDAGFTKAKQWLKLCEDTHSCVRHPNIPPLLPARVIDVGESPIRLYEPTDGERGKYVCLSHCWGSTSSVCRTTPKTYEAHKENIVWAILPATFRDTINVTRRLGIRFLWIDSLCIIQEDDNDWREQSSLMAEVYGNAFLTIFATSSANGHGGLYPSIPLELRPQQNIVTDRNGIVFRVHIRKNLQDQHLTTPGEVEPSQNRPNWFPLQNRAWAFQERLLSR